MSHVAAVLFFVLMPRVASTQSAQAIDILANHDSQYEIAGRKNPVMTLHAGQAVTLRITAIKAKNRNRDGSIHGFTLLRAKDRKRVPGWDLLLRPGLQEFTLTAPPEAGEYIVVCTVICGVNHEQMNMKVIVLP